MSQEEKFIRQTTLGALAVLTILILTLSILVVTRAPAHAASQASCTQRFVSSPNVGTRFNMLLGVSAVSSNDVWAVGDFANTSVTVKTLVEHWNGSSWSVVSSPNVGTNFNFLDSMSANGPTDVWAVGDLQNIGDFNQTLIEHWDGTSWSVIPNPAANYKGFGGILHGVAASNNRTVWAVGETANNTGGHNPIDQTLTERWTPDTGWRVLRTPPIGTSFSFLDAVSALKARSGPAVVWAVGEFANSSGPEQTLTELIVC